MHKYIVRFVQADTKRSQESDKNHIRARFRFDLIKNTLIALTGIRGRSTARHFLQPHPPEDEL